MSVGPEMPSGGLHAPRCGKEGEYAGIEELTRLKQVVVSLRGWSSVGWFFWSGPTVSLSNPHGTPTARRSSRSQNGGPIRLAPRLAETDDDGRAQVTRFAGIVENVAGAGRPPGDEGVERWPPGPG